MQMLMLIYVICNSYVLLIFSKTLEVSHLSVEHLFIVCLCS